MTNWLKVYYEFNTELQQHEVLLVGEIDGKIAKSVFPIPSPITDANFSSFIKQLDVVLNNVYRVDTAPTV